MVVGSLSAVTDYRVRFQYTAGLAREKGFFRNGITLDRKGMLDLSILHGDGTNVVAKKGAGTSGTRDTNIRKERRRLR